MSEKYTAGDKTVGIEEKRLDVYDASPITSDQWVPPEQWIDRLLTEYSGNHSGNSETLPTGSDINRIVAAIFTLNEEESVKVLKDIFENSKNDYTIDQNLLRRCGELIQGHEACEMEEGEWAYTVCKQAGIIHNWSPYVEVRAVSLPYDDPDEPCESVRAYLIGFFWVCCATAVNTCEFAHVHSNCCY